MKRVVRLETYYFAMPTSHELKDGKLVPALNGEWVRKSEVYEQLDELPFIEVEE